VFVNGKPQGSTVTIPSGGQIPPELEALDKLK